MTIGTFAIISVLFVIILGLIIYLYLKSDNDKRDFKHESEMKELEVLFEKNQAEAESVIKEYETYIINFQAYYHNITEIIRISDDKIREIDSKGSFRSDDEIGFFFKNIKEIQDILNGFDFNKPVIKKELQQEPTKDSPILPNGKSNVIVISQEQAEQIAASVK